MAKNNLDLIIIFIAIAVIILISIIINYKKQEADIPANAHVCTDAQKSAQVCTLEYYPVCGSDGVTYGNGCFACANKIDYYIQGECE